MERKGRRKLLVVFWREDLVVVHAPHGSVEEVQMIRWDYCKSQLAMQA